MYNKNHYDLEMLVHGLLVSHKNVKDLVQI